jgi:hypothetical protein
VVVEVAFLFEKKNSQDLILQNFSNSKKINKALNTQYMKIQKNGFYILSESNISDDCIEI